MSQWQRSFFFLLSTMEQEDLCLAIDEELAAFLRCVDNYETSSREVRYPEYNPVLKKASHAQDLVNLNACPG